MGNLDFEAHGLVPLVVKFFLSGGKYFEVGLTDAEKADPNVHALVPLKIVLDVLVACSPSCYVF